MMHFVHDFAIKTYFSAGFLIISLVTLYEANDWLSLILRITGLISFSIYILLTYPRIKVRIKKIFEKW